jgi:copper chaperone NosL
MRIRMLWLITLALMAGACGARASGPPEIVVDRTACSHCRMLISEPLYAAAYETAAGEARVFDDIACLRHAALGETGALTFWFHDAADEGWIDGEAATFVASPEIRSPMGGGLIAYRDRAAAERAAAAAGGRVITSVAEMLAAKEEQ